MCEGTVDTVQPFGSFAADIARTYERVDDSTNHHCWSEVCCPSRRSNLESKTTCFRLLIVAAA